MYRAGGSKLLFARSPLAGAILAEARDVRGSRSKRERKSFLFRNDERYKLAGCCRYVNEGESDELEKVSALSRWSVFEAGRARELREAARRRGGGERGRVDLERVPVRPGSDDASIGAFGGKDGGGRWANSVISSLYTEGRTRCQRSGESAMGAVRRLATRLFRFDGVNPRETIGEGEAERRDAP
ncbi:hypothetical protein KM043_000933 [Ampulex compressa]|nr:hypothetical protein KM043_000933 [Ampulex compressa]